MAEADSVSAYAPYVSTAAERFGIPEAWIYAVMRVESGGRIRAISPKGASGLMQIMPATWTYLRPRYGLGDDIFDVRENILGGAAYLRELYDRYGSPGFLAAYNAGPLRYEAYLRTGRPLPAETVAYVSRLAPAARADGVSPIPSPRFDPLAWTRASLFPRAQASADQTISIDQNIAQPASSTLASPRAPANGGLFIPLSGQHGQ